MDFWIIILSLVVGIVVGLSGIADERLRRIEDPFIQGALLLLLVAMGIKIGTTDRLLVNLDSIGITALALSSASVLGSILFIQPISWKFRCIPEGRGDSDEIAKTKLSLGLTGIILLTIVGGVAIGYFLVGDRFVSVFDSAVTFTLALLLFAVGISLGLNRRTFTRAFKVGWKVILIPLSIAAGSIAGPVALSFFLDVTCSEAAAVGAGFGWYSLSAILLTELHSPELGTIALMANTFREVFTFISLPFIVRYLGKAAGIATGGATTMDVTLPLIKNVAGEESVLPAFLSGAILSGLVPVLVPLLINLQ
ncbi:lysine exporter LysO family protein [Candidatus Bipolaricaulota bacterium]|nr:lysine exporter LysO family protein [Candidatus Bipolaricaulota bacterium]